MVIGGAAWLGPVASAMAVSCGRALGPSSSGVRPYFEFKSLVLVFRNRDVRWTTWRDRDPTADWVGKWWFADGRHHTHRRLQLERGATAERKTARR